MIEPCYPASDYIAALHDICHATEDERNENHIHDGVPEAARTAMQMILAGVHARDIRIVQDKNTIDLLHVFVSEESSHAEHVPRTTNEQWAAGKTVGRFIREYRPDERMPTYTYIYYEEVVSGLSWFELGKKVFWNVMNIGYGYDPELIFKDKGSMHRDAVPATIDDWKAEPEFSAHVATPVIVQGPVKRVGISEPGEAVVLLTLAEMYSEEWMEYDESLFDLYASRAAAGMFVGIRVFQDIL